MLGGTIIGGTITFADGETLTMTTTGGLFTGVTVNGDLNFTTANAALAIYGWITLNGTAHLSGSGASIRSRGNQTFGGTGTIAFEGDTGSTRNLTIEGISQLTLASTFTIRGGRGHIGSQVEQGGTNGLINQGTIVAD